MDIQNVAYLHSYNRSAIKRNDAWIHVTTLMNLENITQSERSHIKRPHINIILSKLNVRNRQIDRDGRQISGYLQATKGNMGVAARGTGFLSR